MINMRVNDYVIATNDMNIVVTKYVRDESGAIAIRKDRQGEPTESTKFVGYYPSLEHALDGIKRHHVLGDDTDIQNIDDYRKEVRAITRAFKEQLKLVGE